MCLLDQDIYPKHVIEQAIRRSLRGDAAKIAMRLGCEAPVRELLQFDSVFGVVETKEALLTQFYSARQKADEELEL